MHTPPSHPAAPADRDGLAAAYEKLRRQFLNRQQGPGLALFIRRGMGDWMNACSLFTAPPPITVLTTTTNDEAVLAQGVRAEVVLILAGMLLHCQEPCP